LVQNVIVTGGGEGIGRAICEGFLEAGAQVHVCDIDPDHLASVAASHERVRGTVGDVANPGDVGRMLDEARSWMGPIDVLVNNAGIAGRRAPLEDLSDEDWDRVMRVNLYGMFHTMRQLVPSMKARRSGCIVNISTGSVRSIPVQRSVYNVSKAAVEGLTRTMARELGPFNIRVNAVQPGMVDNARMRAVVQRIADQEELSYEEIEARFLQFISMRSKIAPREIADMVTFLAADRAAHVTGQIIAVDGHLEWEQ